MKKTGIMTDSHSGILNEEAERLGIKVLPMPFYKTLNARHSKL